MSTLLWETLRKWKILGAFVSPRSPVQPAAPGCWAVTGGISLTRADERMARKTCISERQKRYSVRENRHNRYGQGGDWSERGWLCSMRVLVISHECTYGYHQLCLSVSLTATGSEVSVCHEAKSFSHEDEGRLEERTEIPFFFHPQLSIQTERENLTWLTWAHLASLANRKCPLQLFMAWEEVSQSAL